MNFFTYLLQIITFVITISVEKIVTIWWVKIQNQPDQSNLTPPGDKCYRGPSSQQQQQILSFDNFQVSHSIHQKINDELFYKISVENLVGHPIFSSTKNTIKGSSHSKSEEITSWSMELSSLLICLPIVQCVGFFPLSFSKIWCGAQMCHHCIQVWNTLLGIWFWQSKLIWSRW